MLPGRDDDHEQLPLARRTDLPIHFRDSQFISVGQDLNVYNYNTPGTGISIYHPPGNWAWNELNRLVARGAAYDSAERSPPPRCHEGTRMEILGQIRRWIHGGTDLCWLHGPAGAGKSAVAQTTAEICAREGKLAASFFFSRSSPTRNTMTPLFPTLVVQIAMRIYEGHRILESILGADPHIFGRASGALELIDELFAKVASENANKLPVIVIIDGLDECGDDNDRRSHDSQRRIISQLFGLAHKDHIPLRFLLVSRPEPHIREELENSIAAGKVEEMSLYGDCCAHEDIRTYLSRVCKNS